MNRMTESAEQAYARIWQEHQAIAQRMARYYASGAAEPEDLVQEIAAQVWLALPRFRGESKPGTWFYRVALNTCLSYRRKKRPESFPAARPPDPPGEDLAARLDQQDLLRQVRRLAEGFRPADRSLLLLLLEGLSYEEMAEITGMTVNHVGVRISRIRARLHQALSNEARY